MKHRYYKYLLVILSMSSFLHAQWKTEEMEIRSDLTGGTYKVTVLHDANSAGDKLVLAIDSESSNSALIQEWKNTTFETPPPALATIELSNNPVQIASDLTADALKRVTGSGNADKFHKFIVTTVLPRVQQTIGTQATQLTLLTHNKSAAFGFFAMFRSDPVFSKFIFDSPDMEWHESYPFRGEYNFYKSMASELPVEAIFIPMLPETTEQSVNNLSMLHKLLGYRSYQHFKYQFIETVDHSSTDRMSILKPYLD